jgi:hypothetical protein
MILIRFCNYKCGFPSVKGLVEGDDSLFQAVADQTELQNWFERMGCVIKIERFDDCSTASFCGNVYNRGDFNVIKDPSYLLAGFGWSNNRYVRAGHRVRMELCKSKALSMAYQYGSTPIVGVFAKAVLDKLNTVTIRSSIIDALGWKKQVLEQAIASIDHLKIGSTQG